MQRRGAVWWGRLSYAGGSVGLAPEWVAKFRQQLEGSDTYVFLHSSIGGTWRARMLEITTDRDEVDEKLVPAYYDDAAYYSLWVKLAEFEQSEPRNLVERYVLERTGAPVTSKGLNNQTPLIVRRGPVCDQK